MKSLKAILSGKTYQINDNLFATPSRRIELYSQALEHIGFDPLPTYQEPERSPLSADKAFLGEYPLILSTGHRNYYFTHSQHRNVKMLRDEAPEPETEIGLKTAEKYQIKNGDEILSKQIQGR